ncbi:hypothetical protein BY996DRAFT_7738724 [Phakopsora pachyrhizi]|nr:hypothetical protein BY996DRAFT_7738724 [Phakopsora pachyrhizi]
MISTIQQFSKVLEHRLWKTLTCRPRGQKFSVFSTTSELILTLLFIWVTEVEALHNLIQIRITTVCLTNLFARGTWTPIKLVLLIVIIAIIVNLKVFFELKSKNRRKNHPFYYLSHIFTLFKS